MSMSMSANANEDFFRWRDFVSEPPKLRDTENMDIVAASKGSKPGEFYIDIAGYNITNNSYERDNYNFPIEWWRPIGPLPPLERGSGQLQKILFNHFCSNCPALRRAYGKVDKCRWFRRPSGKAVYNFCEINGLSEPECALAIGYPFFVETVKDNPNYEIIENVLKKTKD
jgi:hypothetical protein